MMLYIHLAWTLGPTRYATIRFRSLIWLTKPFVAHPMNWDHWINDPVYRLKHRDHDAAPRRQ